MKKGVKITIGIFTALIISTLVYLMFIKKDSKLYILKGKGSDLDPLQKGEAQSGNASGVNEIADPSPSGNSGGGFFTGSSTGNPFTSKKEVKEFQEYVLNVIKDSEILGSYGADGIWGSRTAKAYDKYGQQYDAFKNPLSKVKSNLKSKGLDFTITSDGAVRTVFTRGNFKYVARFYSNRRVVFYIFGQKNYISKGNYSDGGKTIVITEGRREGSTFNNLSVLSNMQNATRPTTSAGSSTTQAIGKKIYPKKNFVNVRETPEVDDGWFSNRLGRINSPNVIGKVTNFTLGSESTPKIWYEVDLLTALSDSEVPNVKKGWVRSDVVKF